MPEKPEILKTEVIASSKLFEIEAVDLRFSNGELRTFERIRGHGVAAVMIVPMLDDDTFLLVREYGVGVERYELGLPKGRVEDGEDIIAAANREMMEEVGYGSNNITYLKKLSQAPAYFGANMHIVIARDLYPEKHQGDEPEELEVVPWKLSKLHDLIQTEDFNEARSIATLCIVKDRLGK